MPPGGVHPITPHWIVRYLVENSLGRLWLLNRPNSTLAAKMDYYIAPEEIETDFLRISRPEDIRICDPACGSGHMLTYAFDLLYAIYEEEGYEATEIPGLILIHNLYGIEIDDRAGALAAFALAMKAATKLGRRKFLRQAVQPNICVLQDVRFTPSEMQDVAAVVGSDLFTADFRETMGQFEQAKNFGSLIVPKLRDPAEVARVVRLKDFGGDLLLREVQERVLKVLEMAEALSPKYHVVVANPPYAGAKGLNPAAQAFLKELYAEAKYDLFSAFIERGGTLVTNSGFNAMVTMESWMFLSSFERFRSGILSEFNIQSLVHMPYSGKGGTSMGINFGTSAFVLEKSANPSLEGTYCCIRYYETNESGVPHEFPTINERFTKVSPRELTKLPGTPISYWASDAVRAAFETGVPLKSVGDTRQGMATSDNGRFLREWFEVSIDRSCLDARNHEEAKSSKKKWFPYNKGGAFRKWYGNSEHFINWENGGFEVLDYAASLYGSPTRTIKSMSEYFKPSISWSKVTSGGFSMRHFPAGYLFDVAGCSIFAEKEDNLNTLLGFTNSPVAVSMLESTSPTLNFEAGQLAQLPVFKDHFQKSFGAIAEILVNMTKSDWDAYETSWDFKTLPLLAPDLRGETLRDTYSRLRTYWQDLTVGMKRREEESNRIFIEAYGMADELTSEVPLEEVTLTCNPTYRYGGKSTSEELEVRLLSDTIAEFLHYAVGCMFGRYSLDIPGLILANQGETLAEYFARVPQPTFKPDADNVIPVLDGDWFADDIAERFRKFLRVTFGEAKFQENLAFIEGALGKDIRKWFTRDFYDYHVRRYKKRPIYWMFASPKGSFQALIYMHRYRPDTVSVVLNDYLREYRNKLEAHRKAQEAQSINSEVTPAQRTKALKEVGEATKVIEELDGYERDVLYPLATQKIEIDLDDGVKSNYPKFGAALKPIKGLSDAGA